MARFIEVPSNGKMVLINVDHIVDVTTVPSDEGRKTIITTSELLGEEGHLRWYTRLSYDDVKAILDVGDSEELAELKAWRDAALQIMADRQDEIAQLTREAKAREQHVEAQRVRIEKLERDTQKLRDYENGVKLLCDTWRESEGEA